MTLHEILNTIDGKLLTVAAVHGCGVGSSEDNAGSSHSDGGRGNGECAGERDVANTASVGGNPLKQAAPNNNGCAGSDSGNEIAFELAFASDLMSDVLTLRNDNVVLLTGLATMQTIRTAEMADINCIIFVRNKKVSQEMVELANESGIDLIECRYSMFRTSGLLYQAGLKPVY